MARFFLGMVHTAVSGLPDVAEVDVALDPTDDETPADLDDDYRDQRFRPPRSPAASHTARKAHRTNITQRHVRQEVLTAMSDVTWIVHRTVRCARLRVTSQQWVRAPADSLAFWNRIDDDAWQVIDSDGDRICGHDLVTVDIYARVVAPRT